MDPTICGLPVTSDTMVSINEKLIELVTAQRSELDQLGCYVERVHVSGDGVPPRLFFSFKPGQPSYQVRNALGDKGYDVGQQMGDKMLRFYASKRVTKGTGWNV